ncbi:MAG TPA: hypothetical protein VHN14_08635, partial [Kofleriaceae bacterium]|nr:hypothetical protein [Kofleriaceae bacterium]
SLYDYMERVLGYRPHTARERMRVARALATLPEMSLALARGGLSYSAVRELTRVATAETEAAWLAASEGLVTNQIESLVAKHRPGDHPDDPADPELRTRVVRLTLPPEVYALWRQARMVVAEARGTEITDADFLETLCRNAIAPGSGADGPAHQAPATRDTIRSSTSIVTTGATGSRKARRRSRSEGGGPPLRLHGEGSEGLSDRARSAPGRLRSRARQQLGRHRRSISAQRSGPLTHQRQQFAILSDQLAK